MTLSPLHPPSAGFVNVRANMGLRRRPRRTKLSPVQQVSPGPQPLPETAPLRPRSHPDLPFGKETARARYFRARPKR